MEFERKYGYIVLDGIWYKESSKDGKNILVEIDAEALKKKEEKCKKIIPTLEEYLDKEKILLEALMKLENNALDSLTRKIKSGKKHTIVTRNGYCVDMKVGNQIIPIIPTDYH